MDVMWCSRTSSRRHVPLTIGRGQRTSYGEARFASPIPLEEANPQGFKISLAKQSCLGLKPSGLGSQVEKHGDKQVKMDFFDFYERLHRKKLSDDVINERWRALVLVVVGGVLALLSEVVLLRGLSIAFVHWADEMPFPFQQPVWCFDIRCFSLTCV